MNKIIIYNIWKNMGIWYNEKEIWKKWWILIYENINII